MFRSGRVLTTNGKLRCRDYESTISQQSQRRPRSAISGSGIFPSIPLHARLRALKILMPGSRSVLTVLQDQWTFQDLWV